MVSEVLRPGGEGRWLGGVAFISLAACVAAFVAGTAIGAPVADIYFGYVQVILKGGIIATPLLAIAVAILALIRRTPSPVAEIRKLIGARMGTVDGALGTIAPIVLMVFLLGAYGTLKQLMPVFAPFAWDDTFAEAGRLMFFGHRPWELTHFLFGGAAPTLFLASVYEMWIPILFLAVFGFSVLAPRYLRARFFVSFAASWLLLGVVAAYLLSSAGPCYAAAVGADSAPGFAPLMAQLRPLNLGTVAWQDMLWEAHASRHYGFGLGISAMPSMHNAIAFLYVLAVSRSPLWMRFITWAFAATILIGSVHLGWHYLADGIVAWVGAAAVWWASGAYLRWCGYAQPETPEAEDSDGELIAEELPEALAA